MDLSFALSDMASIMADRYKNKQWTEYDETEFKKLQVLLLNCYKLYAKQAQELNKIASGPMTNKIYKDIDIKAVMDYHLQINALNVAYCKTYSDKYKAYK
jgi:hypothetical protein